MTNVGVRSVAVRLLYLRGVVTINAGGGLAGRSLVRHLSAENDVLVRTYVVPPSGGLVPDGRDFIAEEDLFSFDAVIMERGWNDPQGPPRLAEEAGIAYVQGGGVLVVLDADRNAASRQQEPLQAASNLLGALPDYVDGSVAYLHDPGAREPNGAYRFFADEMAYYVDWLRPAYQLIESLLVSAPVMLHVAGDIAASGHSTTRVLADDAFKDPPYLTPWASATGRGLGVTVLVGAGFTSDVLIDECPDNARWLSAVLQAACARAAENRAWSRAPSSQPSMATMPATDIQTTLASDEGQHLERKSSFLTTVSGGIKEPSLKHAVLKSLAAFLNSDGGLCVIGQADDGTVLGLESDYRALPTRSQNRDGLQRAIQDSVSASLGAWVNLPLWVQWHDVDGKDVLVITCGRAKAGVWLSGKFYVRQENSTVPLEGPALETYVRRRFGS